MSGKYRTIVADPPWDHVTTRMGRGGRRANKTQLDYADRLMATEEIAAVPVEEIVADQAHLYLWSTRRLFREGTAAMIARAWGFEPVGEIVWGLRNPGMGSRSIANDHEPVLVATRGALPFTATEPIGVWFWRQFYEVGKAGVPQKVHSAKPEGFFELVEQASPGPYLEMFARRGRLGWDYYGDQSLGTAEMPEAAA